MKKLTGVWMLSYPNNYEVQYNISIDGKITTEDNSEVFLKTSDNQEIFPSLDGWLKIDKTHRNTTWEYIRLQANGTLEIRHFSSDNCTGIYKNLHYYCCVTEGIRIGKYIYLLVNARHL